MALVFGRNGSGAHPLAQSLAKLQASTDEGRRAMAYNLMHDHRVSEAREAAFLSYIARQKLSTTEIGDIVKAYHRERVREARHPDFLEPAINGENFRSGPHAGPLAVNSNLEVGRVLVLNGLWTACRWATREHPARYPALGTVPGEGLEFRKRVQEWLTEKLSTSAGQRTSFVQAALKAAWHHHLEIAPYQPAWVAPWEDLKTHLEHPSKPRRWLEVMGAHKQAPCWIIVLRYQVREVGQLLRPTQLEAGWFAYHFPSPPAQYLISTGGHPMDLSIPCEADGVLQEYVHDQIRHPIEHWHEAGSFCEPMETPPPEELALQRQRHHQALCEHYSAAHVLPYLPSI